MFIMIFPNIFITEPKKEILREFEPLFMNENKILNKISDHSNYFFSNNIYEQVRAFNNNLTISTSPSISH